MIIAVQGCLHGELRRVYDSIALAEKLNNVKVDLLIISGDFQAMRHSNDLDTLQVPPKYKVLGDFPDYYSGRVVAPIPTLFIGGNHEASGYMRELITGGFAAENIYFMGSSGVIRFGPLRIAGLSGIFKPQSFQMGHIHQPPYSPGTIRSAYHVRRVDMARLALLQHPVLPGAAPPVNVFLSHDWPVGITDFGDCRRLIRSKPYFEEDIRNRELGNPLSMDMLLRPLRPHYWFSAHLHVKFAALVPHSPAPGPAEPPAKRPRTGDHTPLGDATGAEASAGCEAADQAAGPAIVPESKVALACTRFLALDKCHPRGHFIQLVPLNLGETVPGPAGEDGPASTPRPAYRFEYDDEWLLIMRRTNAALFGALFTEAHQERLLRQQALLAEAWKTGEGPYAEHVALERQWLADLHAKHATNDGTGWGGIPVLPFEPSLSDALPTSNPQSSKLSQMLGLEDFLRHSAETRACSVRDWQQRTFLDWSEADEMAVAASAAAPPTDAASPLSDSGAEASVNLDAIDLDDEDDDWTPSADGGQGPSQPICTANPDAIDLDDDDDADDADVDGDSGAAIQESAGQSAEAPLAQDHSSAINPDAIDLDEEDLAD